MTTRKASVASPVAPTALLGDIRALIEAARKRAASTVNSKLTMFYWRIGQRIRSQVLDGRRGAYGKEVLPTLGEQLVKEYGGSFAEQNLRRMVQFAATFPDEKILVSLIRELSWTHFIALIPLKDPLQRDYYAQMASAERWSVRTLRERIDSMLYERTALSKKSEETIAQELATLRDAQRITPALVMRYRISSTSWGCGIAGRKAIWKQPSSVKWKPSCWRWVRASVSSPGRNASRSATRISTLTCCFTTASCGGWWPSN